ncbi:nuclear protein localization protein 4 [Spathaspora passalidarum NRRL Y-27907]|uniref:Nuclear protein localization protein 4 n=1 Tax=Spathaspora passalidarum (strain NRRL Y-27907 / 11-Y1) TaxID=619300 RepID=G3AGF9_SPAPN|nr:nuclear protein localization protein 4 [Spathaspora passalidarum NRRL Y-27907]EGW35298.1 nuclear protein localization protein 4 [Spathaspora passalidarum NRRL Y-27907]
MASIILRFRSKDGMFRINTSSDSDFVSVLEQLLTKLSSAVNSQSLLLSNSPSQKGEPAKGYCGKTVQELGLKNGDMLFVSYETAIDPNAVPTSTPTVPITTTNLGPTKVQELPIDIALDKQEGLIARPLSSMCRHGARGMCEYCAPLPPWDENYRSEHAIKHISFHAYLKQQAEKHKNNGGSYIAPLEEPDYKIDLHCQQGHQPYPKGICSKCQPSPITLQQQKFRMVDHVEFADSSILNEFLNGWRSTGVQRFGYLYGRYEAFDKVPLGIKAVVESIYEPPQVGEFDGVTLLNWDDEQQIDAIASKLGLTKVGIAYTDLTDSGRKDGTVLCKRHKDSYFLTNLECIMAARFQHKYPNVTKYTSSGKFSSKFVTCVVSGGLLGEIEPRSYQVSTGAEALVEADIITGCTQPSMVYVNENSSTRYVPDIQYSKINEYGLEVKSNAKPTFPVDFLLVSLTDSFPVDPTPMFTSEYHYTIENREFMGDVQDLSTVYKYLNGGDYEVRKAKLCNFHFLCHLARLNILGPQEMESIFKFIVDKNEDDYIRLVESPGWMSLITILEENK